MIDTLRLSISSDLFALEDMRWIRSLQSKLSLSNFDGDAVKWTMIQGLKLPSWFDGFHLLVGSDVVIEASPKIYQGHNVTGPDNLLAAASFIVNHIFGRVFKLFSWPDPALWLVRRIDITFQFSFGTFEAFQMWADTAAGVSRGVRRASMDVSEPVQGFEGFGVSRTLYIGKHSRYRSGKIYNKGSELTVHMPRSVAGSPDWKAELFSEFSPVGRFESVNRALYISYHAMDLVLVPDRFKGMDAGAYRENVIRYLSQENIPHSVTKSKEPLVLFSVGYLSEKLNLKSLWHSEFHHLFSIEAAMDDSTLITRLKLVCPTDAQACKAFAFLQSVRSLGLSLSRQTISKAQWYRYRAWFEAAGLSDAQLQDGAPLVRVALDPVRIYDFKVESERLKLIELSHSVTLDDEIARLHKEVFKRAG